MSKKEENRYRVVVTPWSDYVPQVKYWYWPFTWVNMRSWYNGFVSEERAWEWIKIQVKNKTMDGKPESEL